jgi:F0F1-type ATP synthase assembly protein I
MSDELAAGAKRLLPRQGAAIADNSLMGHQTEIARANESLQENLDRGKPVIFASYAVVGAILLCGGAGYALDRMLGTLPWGFLGGIVLGLFVAFYTLVQRTR